MGYAVVDTPTNRTHRQEEDKLMAQVTIDTNNITAMDLQLLAILSGGEQATTKSTTKSAAKPAESEGPTLEDAIARATKMVSEGQTAAVKAALSSVGAKRVSELEADKVPAFLDALDV
jgi:hypothetical protein